MAKEIFESAVYKLQKEFPKLNWKFNDIKLKGKEEQIYNWPGLKEEEIIICVHKSNGIQEKFHRHDFFYFNYTYKGQYDSLSHKYNNLITISESELYAGQPFAGHALCVHDNDETIIIGVLIKKETFCRAFLPIMSSKMDLFNFFLNPTTNFFSEEFIHFKIEDDCNIRTILEIMVIEYANRQIDTQDTLKSLVLAFLMQVAKQYTLTTKEINSESLIDKMLQYINEHFDTVTLKEIASKFSYNPNYISSLLHKELGKSFNQLILERRMERALNLLRNTSLTISEIAIMLGYSNSSNFYKAFRKYYETSPREYIEKLNIE